MATEEYSRPPDKNKMKRLVKDWLESPHWILLLVIFFAFVGYLALNTETEDRNTNRILGFMFVVMLYLVYSCLNEKDSFFIRPHPIFWRFVKGGSVIYLMILVFALFQNLDEIRQSFNAYPWWILPTTGTLGVPLPEYDYASDCRIYTPENPDSNFANVKGNVFDFFIIAHVAGWFSKGIMLRDYVLCWSASLLFEFVEFSLRHHLPNFGECWWDKWVLDVLLCNGIGIYVGMQFVKMFGGKQYNYAPISINEERTLFWRVIRAFSPLSWDTFKWDILDSPKNYVAVLLMVYLVTAVDVNSFYLKTIFWLPPSNFLNIYRVIVWYFALFPASREIYFFFYEPTCKRLGGQAWICLGLYVAELFVIFKFGKQSGHFTEPWPKIVIWSWSIAGILIVLFPIVYFGLVSKRRSGGINNDGKAKNS